MTPHVPHPNRDRLIRIAAGITIAIGIVVISGWIIGSVRLTQILPLPETMKFNTALAFVAAGSALWLLTNHAPKRHIIIGRRLCAILTMVIGAFTLIEYLGGWNLGIGEFVLHDNSLVMPTHAIRMSPITALNFILVGGALICIDRLASYRTAQTLTIMALGLSLLAAIGYLYSVASLYRISRYSTMSLQTAVTFLVLGIGLLSMTAQQGLVRLIVGPGVGGVLARRLLPAALLVPSVLGWLCLLGQRAGLYDSAFGLALFALSNMLIFTALIMHSAIQWHQLDSARNAAETHLRHLSADLEARVLERTIQLQAANQALSQKVLEREQAESHIRALLEAAPDAIVIIDSHGFIRLVNAQFETLFGYSRTVLINQSIDLLVPERFRNAHSTHRSGYFHNPHVRSMGTGTTLFALRNDGSEFPVEISLSPIETGDELLVSASIRDITDRMVMENALRASETKLRTLFEVLPVGICILDANRQIVDMNPALDRIFLLAPGEIQTPAYNERSYIRADGKPIPPEELPSRRAVEEQRPILDMELGVVLQTGQTIWTSVSATPLPAPDHGVVIVSTDITARFNAENALQEANRELTQRIDQLTILNQLAEQVQLCVLEDEVYEVAAAFLNHLFPNSNGAIYMITNSRTWVEPVLTWGEFAQDIGVFGVADCWALRRGQLHHTGIESPTIMCRHIPTGLNTMTLCIPLLAQGEAQGLLHIRIPESLMTRSFNAIQYHVLQVAADSIALALANVKLRTTLHQQSIRDPLTSLFNRRYMEEAGEREMQRANRTGRTMGIIMLDVDHFKRVNDSYGHEVGDRVLRQLGHFLREATRSDDIACRYGGEEFVLILPEAALEHTQQRAEELRQMFKDLALHTTYHLLDPITLSFGVAAYPIHGATLESLLKTADEALYQAKHRGRDQVVVAPPLSD